MIAQDAPKQLLRGFFYNRVLFRHALLLGNSETTLPALANHATVCAPHAMATPLINVLLVPMII